MRAPIILVEILGSVARRLRSVSGSLQDQSQRRFDDQFESTPSLRTRLADLVMHQGATWQAFLLFAIAMCTWIYLHKRFDPGFNKLNLVLTGMAAASAPAVLLVLNRIQERDEFAVRSRVHLRGLLQAAGEARRNAQAVRDRLKRLTPNRFGENPRSAQAPSLPGGTSATPTTG